MTVNKMLPLLSDGLRGIVKSIQEKHSCSIANDLIEADNLINCINRYLVGERWFDTASEFCNSGIAAIQVRISKLINEEARMLSFRHNAFEISYLPKGKEAKYSDAGIWSRENRQTAKPARLIQKLLVNSYKCKEFEDFSNWIKAEMLNAGVFTLVSGSDITKYYLEDNYFSCDGTLGNSCMRHSECQDYFKIYEDCAKMLVCKKEDKILGRAIVWEIDGKFYMDRVYTCMDYLESQFIDYAQLNKWYHRETNSLLSDGEYQCWLGPEDNYENAQEYDLQIILPTHYEYMPYVDSFRYYSPDDNTIYTNPKKGIIRLSSTEGYYDEEAELYCCEHCGAEERVYDGDGPQTLFYSEYEESYYCEDCAVYCDGIDDYICKTTPSVLVNISRDSYERYPLDYVEDDSRFVKINNDWYDTEECSFVEYDEKREEYIIKDE